MDQPLGDTRDRLTIGAPLPGEHPLPASEVETTIRHHGTHWIIAGASLLAADVIAVLTTAILVEHLNLEILLLICLSAMLLLATGGALVTAGLVEWTQRPTRTLIRAAMARAETNGKTAEGTRELVNALIVEVGKLRREVEEQRTVQTAMAGALDEIATYLPENQEIHNWRGFNAAVKERLANGTDSSQPPGQRSGRLGLVKNEGPQA